jgi:pilus assembly protein CpaF
MRALCSEIPARERIVTIEQAFELGLDATPERHPDLVALEARTPNAEGEGEINMARLVRRALRMNADRVIVGEVMGDEVLPMLNAMSQGRSGSMCTIHADSSSGVFRRLASYAAQAPERLPIDSTNVLIAGAVHFVVFVDAVDETADFGSPKMQHLVWSHRDSGSAGGERSFEAIPRRRYVASVREVVDAEGLQVISNEIYRVDRHSGRVPGAPICSSSLDELVDNGFDPALLRPTVERW